jgi:hypothetical protein
MRKIRLLHVIFISGNIVILKQRDQALLFTVVSGPQLWSNIY